MPPVEVAGNRKELADAALDRLRLAGAERAEVGLILGSGLSDLAGEASESVTVPYASIPGFPRVTVPGHAGNFVAGSIDGVRVVFAQGRYHPYEGYDPASVALPIRVFEGLGARLLIVTNAAGSLDRGNPPGTLMAIRDHINLQFANPLIGRRPDVRNLFPDLSSAYATAPRRLLHRVAVEEGIRLAEGVYGAVLGPSYETRAEVRFLRRIGTDAAGMSTVGEVVAAAEIGLPVLGISLLTNFAAGLGEHPLSHDEVTAAAETARPTLARLLRAFLAAMGRE